jgi:hypothetical protein
MYRASRRPAVLPAILACALAAFVAVASAITGCAPNDINGTPLQNAGLDAGLTGDDDGSTSVSSTSGGSSSGCVSSRPPSINPSSLPSCCSDGAAHCVPTEYVPGADTKALASCSGGYCVPDPFITDPSYQPPACTAFNSTPGVCLSLCVPQVSQYKTILTQATCGATELCAPCTNPLTNQPSGACAFAPPTTCSADGGTTTSPGGGDTDPGDAGTAPAVCPYTGPPLLDPSTLPACGTAGGAHCLQGALVPAALQSQLATCSGGYCVPDVFIEAGGNYIPPTCSSLDGAEGRCLNVVIPQVAAEESQLTQSSCETYERCVPCFSPINGEKTGACNLSCDPGPTKPIVLFPSCCSENGTDEGRCVPTQIVPSSEQSNLGQNSCAQDAGLCVPSEMLSIATFMPPACEASGFLVGAYTGVCLSNCLSFGIQGLVLAQGSCDSIHTCAPCKNPLTGQPTGAPGCP